MQEDNEYTLSTLILNADNNTIIQRLSAGRFELKPTWECFISQNVMFLEVKTQKLE